MRRQRRIKPRDLPWDEDPRNPDMKVLRSYREEIMPGYFVRREELVTPEQSQRLSRDGLIAAECDPKHHPSWDNDPTYF